LAVTRELKQQLLDGYAQKVSRAQVMIWCNYTGAKVGQLTDLRRQIRPSGAEVVVVKNTLMRLTLQRANLPVVKELSSGPCAVTFVYGDMAGAAKVVTDFARANEAVFKVLGGLMGSRFVTADQVRLLTSLPSCEVMLGRVLASMQAPIAGLVGTLGAVMRGLVNVLDAHRKQLEGSPSS
jgi:large subunit ribosomal protein L10